MSTQTKPAHAPLPWKVFGRATKSSNFGDWRARIVTDDNHKHDSVAYAIDRPMDREDAANANAELIVRAVNAHEALAAALESALEHLMDEPDPQDGGQLSVHESIRQAKDALKQARGADV